MKLGLEGKVALITGAARGIGRVTARALHDEGANVAILDLDRRSVDEAADELGDDRAMGVVADVVDLASVSRAVAEISQRWHSPDILVNNAGMAFKGDRFDTEVVDRTFLTNVTGLINVYTALGPMMKQDGKSGCKKKHRDVQSKL